MFGCVCRTSNQIVLIANFLAVRNLYRNDASPSPEWVEEHFVAASSYAITDSDGNDGGKDLTEKDDSSWRKLPTFQSQCGWLQQRNMVRFGPTAFATTLRSKATPRILFSEAVFWNIHKCAVSEAQLVTGDVNWNVAVHELDRLKLDLLIPGVH